MSMSEESRALLNASRGAHGPTVAQKAALKASLMNAAGSSVLAGATAAGSSVVLKLIVGALAAALVTTGGVFAWRHTAQPAAPVPAIAVVVPVAPVDVAAAAPQPVEQQQAAAMPTRPPMRRTHRAVSVPPVEAIAPIEVAPAPALAPVVTAPQPPPIGELPRLQSVLAQLRAEQWNAAISSLDDFDRQFPSAMLAVEARAMRVQALCGLGQPGDATALARTLTATASRNPAVARLRSGCASSAFDAR